MKHLLLLTPLCLVALLSQGCGVFLAASQPGKVDTEVFAAGGMPRDMVIAKLGAPVSSVRNQDGSRTDIYEFYEGSDPGWKYGRAAFHAAADFFTLALWEIVATPTEMAVKGNKISARAEFDQNDTLKEFYVLGANDQRNRVAPQQTGSRS